MHPPPPLPPSKVLSGLQRLGKGFAAAEAEEEQTICLLHIDNGLYEWYKKKQKKKKT